MFSNHLFILLHTFYVCKVYYTLNIYIYIVCVYMFELTSKVINRLTDSSCLSETDLAVSSLSQMVFGDKKRKIFLSFLTDESLQLV